MVVRKKEQAGHFGLMITRLHVMMPLLSAKDFFDPQAGSRSRLIL